MVLHSAELSRVDRVWGERVLVLVVSVACSSIGMCGVVVQDVGAFALCLSVIVEC